MKQTVQLKKIQENMTPGKITSTGFIGDDNRNLIDILTADQAKVKRLNLTNRRIAEKMKELRNKGMEGLGDYVSVEPHFDVRVESIRGKLPCPFNHPGLYPKTVTIVKNLEKGKTVTYTDLSIHFIEAHGFFQGKGSLYRLDPEELMEVLEIEPIPPDYRTPLEKEEGA